MKFLQMIIFLQLLWTVSAERITTPPDNVIVFVGDPVKLQCAVEFSGTNTINWEFNGNPVYYYQFGEEEYPNDSKNIEGFSVEQDGTNFNVVLQQATYSAAGKYACKLTSAEAVAHLIVLGKPHLVPSVPKPEEGNIAVYTCEARFGGPKKSEVSPDIYPRLRISLGGKFIDGTTHLQEPKNSTQYHVLGLVYHTILNKDMHDWKKLTCEIVTDNPKVVASTHETIRVKSFGTTSQTGVLQAEDTSGAVQAGVAFAVINFLLIVGIIVGVIAYKFVLKNNPRFQKMFGKYQPVKQNEDKDSDTEAPPPLGTKEKAVEQNEDKDSDTEAPPPLGTKEKVQSAKGTQKPKKDKTTKSSKKGAIKENKKEPTEDTTTTPTMKFEPAKPSKTPHGTDIELQEVETNEPVKSPEKPQQHNQPQPSQTQLALHPQLPSQQPSHLEQPSQPPSSTPQTPNLTETNHEEQPQNTGGSQEMAAREGAGQAAKRELEGQLESTYSNKKTENTSTEEKLTSAQEAEKKTNEAKAAADVAEKKGNEAKEAVNRAKKAKSNEAKEAAKTAVQMVINAQKEVSEAEQKVNVANTAVEKAETEFKNTKKTKEEVKKLSKDDKNKEEQKVKDIENKYKKIKDTVNKAGKKTKSAKEAVNNAASEAAKAAKKVGINVNLAKDTKLISLVSTEV